MGSDTWRLCAPLVPSHFALERIKKGFVDQLGAHKRYIVPYGTTMLMGYHYTAGKWNLKDERR